MDFVARRQVSLHMTYTILDSLLFPRVVVPGGWVVRRIAELALRFPFSSAEMNSYWNLIAGLGMFESVQPIDGEAQPPGFVLDSARCLNLAGVKVLVARSLCGLTRDELAYVVDTCPIVRRTDEAAYGEFRTKRVFLEVSDALTEAEHTDVPHQSRLDPLLADPRVAYRPSNL
jgi:hypothetical protein